MTEVDFYFNAGDPLEVACRLAGKALGQRKRMVIYADAETLSRVDRLLWSIPAIGFVPHCLAEDPLAADTPVLLAANERTPHCEVMLNLGQECPPHFERFERLLEVVGADEQAKAAGRERYRFYKQRGYKIANHDLAARSAA